MIVISEERVGMWGRGNDFRSCYGLYTVETVDLKQNMHRIKRGRCIWKLKDSFTFDFFQTICPE